MILTARYCARGFLDGVVRSAQKQQLTACVFQLIFVPALADGFGGNKAPDRKLLRRQHGLQRTNTVSKDEDVVAVNEIVGEQRLQSGHRTACSKPKIGLRTIA